MSEQTAELGSSLDTKVNLPQLLEDVGVVTSVATIPAKVSRDLQSDQYVLQAQLPFVGGDMYNEDTTRIFARTITKKDTGARQLSYKTATSGRADYLLPVVFNVESNAGKNIVMSTIMTKGSGSLKALESSGSPFANRGFEIEGAATINDLRLDAANSILLLKAGIRTRVALGVYTLNEIDYEGKTYSPEELLKNRLVANKDDLPGIGVFATRTALRIDDVRRLTQKNNEPGINAFIGYLLRTTEYDDAPEFRNFYQRHKDINGKYEGLPADQRNSIISDYIVSLSAVLGRQAAGFEKIGSVKVVNVMPGKTANHETANNVTCLGESVDNSQLVRGVGAVPMSEFQLSLLDLPLYMPNYMDKQMTNQEIIALHPKITAKFVEAYLDEMMPTWRQSKVPAEGFLTEESQLYGVDKDDIKRAYWVIQLKQKSMDKENVQGKDPSDTSLTDIPYHWLEHIFHLHYGGSDDFSKSKQFLEDMTNYQKVTDEPARKQTMSKLAAIIRSKIKITWNQK